MVTWLCYPVHASGSLLVFYDVFLLVLCDIFPYSYWLLHVITFAGVGFGGTWSIKKHFECSYLVLHLLRWEILLVLFIVDTSVLFVRK